MNSFEYAHPETEVEALEFLNESPHETMILAGGTDLLNLLKQEVVRPSRVVDIKQISSLQGFEELSDGLLIGAATTLAEIKDLPTMQYYPSLIQVIENIHSAAICSMGTLVGDLCHHPNCWYYRNGYGLLGREQGESLPEQGRNLYHAVLGNEGPAKFVSASRFAPALIAMGAQMRIIGPEADQEEWIPLESFYRIPKIESHGTNILLPGQLVTHVWLPRFASRVELASYEVLASEGLDWPTAAASVALELKDDLVQAARIVLGQVAPLPWVAREAARMLTGKRLTDALAGDVAELALAGATPLSENRYKIKQCQAAIKRALISTLSFNKEAA
ncbi:MAG: FAD binding domain-containing protein [Planctomycetaceae bacterium]